MRLISGFLIHEMNGEQYLTFTGAAPFSGLIRSNATAAFIVNCLREETTPAGIAQKLAARYGVSEEIAARDVEDILDKLRKIRVIEE